MGALAQRVPAWLSLAGPSLRRRSSIRPPLRPRLGGLHPPDPATPSLIRREYAEFSDAERYSLIVGPLEDDEHGPWFNVAHPDVVDVPSP